MFAQPMNRFLLNSMAAFMLLALVVVLFNAWVDPYAIYRYRSADALRMSRFPLVLMMRVSKPWQVVQARPTTAIIGSSRSAAIRPGSGRWDDSASMNLSMPGITLYEMRRMIEHAHAHGPLSELVIGLEYETFITGDYKTGLGFAEGRMGAGSPEFALQAVRDLRDTLLTTNVLAHSADVLSNDKAATTFFYPDGSWQNTSNIWRGRSGYVSVGKNLIRLANAEPEVLQDSLVEFGNLLRYCYSQGIVTHLYISPEHLFLTDLRRSLGFAQEWEKFHRQIIQLNIDLAAKFNQAPYPIWGFNHIEGIVDEPLHRGVGTGKDWFRDGIHFNRDLGKVLMAQMLEGQDLPGMELGPRTIDQYFAIIERLRLKFVQAQASNINHYRKAIGVKTPLLSKDLQIDGPN
jgi:hypothetical protein